MRLVDYRRSEIKVSDHRPVTATYMVELEVFSQKKLQRALTFTDAEVKEEDIVTDVGVNTDFNLPMLEEVSVWLLKVKMVCNLDIAALCDILEFAGSVNSCWFIYAGRFILGALKPWLKRLQVTLDRVMFVSCFDFLLLCTEGGQESEMASTWACVCVEYRHYYY